ncbi:transcription factor HES-4 [Anolis carolinensis]|uniref:Hes family bHLH transcription factor 4 n=1 Tax=Anolis carolinensis TaxID=28377 RepID=H9G5B5_ANOCA|nr:PREDICTED: transcription factor HES-4 [Anolis carolinensis]|eukprot:XP_003225980.1 PREDICTED: transcription factor HES-4 [Anolis carolinensis]
MPADTMEKPTASPIAGAPANSSQTPDKPKSASEHRKSSKPIMEKRRRARINESLGQLKTLILDALKKDSSRHSKLEKADILEMTVKHLRNLQRAQMTAALSADPTVLGKYRAGFNECMNEVTRFLSTCEGVNTEVRSRLLGHLSTCLGQIVAMNYPPPPPPPPAAGGQPAHMAQPLHVQLPGPAAPSGAMPVPCKMNPGEAMSPKVYGGFQLVPATDGQFAFLIPNPAFPPGTGPVIPLYANTNMPVSSGSSTATPSVSPVQGLTSFGGSLASVSQAGGERGDAVWRPW